MLSLATSLALLASVSHASPILQTRQANETNPFVFTNSNGLNFTQMNSSLPNVAIFATGKSLPITPNFNLTSTQAAQSPAQATARLQQQATPPAP